MAVMRTGRGCDIGATATPAHPPARTRRNRRCWLVAALGGLLATFATGSTTVVAQGRALTLPAGRLDDALRRLAAASGRQILFDPALVGDRRIGTTTGRADAGGMLGRLLRRTGLAARILPNGIVIIVPAVPPRRQAEQPAARDLVQPEPQGGEIVVTALKRPTMLADTELSIATLSALEIDRWGLSDLRSAARQLPGLLALNTGALQQRLALRGVIGTGEATVGVYFGETPVTGPSGTTGDPAATAPDIDLVDVQRMEVLRGPQGTLYGASSMGGTLRLLPHPVDLERASATVDTRLDLTEGGAPGGAVAAVANLPLVPGTLAVRVVAHRRMLGGYIDNMTLGRADGGALVREGARMRIAWQPAPALQFDTLLLHQHTRIDSGGFWFAGQGRYRNDQPVRTPNRDHLDIASTTLRWFGDGATVTATASHSRWGIVRQIDFTRVLDRQRASESACRRFAGLAAGVSCSPVQAAAFGTYIDTRLPALLYQPSRVTSTSGEVRVSSAPGAMLAWTLGAFRERRRDAVDSVTARADAATGALVRPLDITGLRTIATSLDQHALFAEATRPIAPRVSATLGGRYYRYSRTARGAVPVPNPITGTAAAAVERYRGGAQGANLKAELTYRVPRGPLFYILASEGFRPGGLNVTPGLADDEREFDPDHLWNYEAGAKLARTGWSVEAAIFHIDWDRPIFSASSVNGAFAYNTNLAAVAIDGLEARGTAGVGPVRLVASIAYTYARLTADTMLGTSDGIGHRGDRMPNVPRLAWLVGTDATIARGIEAGVTAGGNDSAPTGFDTANPYYARTAARIEVGAHAGIADGPWRFDVNIDNLFDAVAPVRLLSSAFGERQLYSARPRTLSLRASALF